MTSSGSLVDLTYSSISPYQPSSPLTSPTPSLSDQTLTVPLWFHSKVYLTNSSISTYFPTVVGPLLFLDIFHLKRLLTKGMCCFTYTTCPLLSLIASTSLLFVLYYDLRHDFINLKGLQIKPACFVLSVHHNCFDCRL